MHDDVKHILLDWGRCHRLLDELSVPNHADVERRIHKLVWKLLDEVNRANRLAVQRAMNATEDDTT